MKNIIFLFAFLLSAAAFAQEPYPFGPDDSPYPESSGTTSSRLVVVDQSGLIGSSYKAPVILLDPGFASQTVSVPGHFAADSGHPAMDSGRRYWAPEHIQAKTPWHLQSVPFFAVSLQELAPVTVSAGNTFGSAVAASGAYALVGAPNSKVGTQSKAGAAWLFNVGSPQQPVMLTAPSPEATEYFGNSADWWGFRFIVGAHGDNAQGLTDRGSAYVYGFDGVNPPAFAAKLQPADVGSAYDYFGSSVSMMYSRAVVGARSAKVNGAASQGAAYVFDENIGGAGAWGQAYKLVASDGTANNFFGGSVDQSGTDIFVGAPGNLSNRGAVYVFDGNGIEIQKITAPVPTIGDGFGTAISAFDDILAVSSPNAVSYQGKVFLYQKIGGVWTHFKTLESPTPANGDRFGSALSLTGDELAVGASYANTVFRFDPQNNYSLNSTWLAPAGAERLGASMAHGATLVVGAPLSDPDGKKNAGQAFSN